MAELADAADLKSVGYLNREGSSPSLSIIFDLVGEYEEVQQGNILSWSSYMYAKWLYFKGDFIYYCYNTGYVDAYLQCIRDKLRMSK